MEIKVAEYSDYTRIAKLHAQSWRVNYKDVLDAEYLEDKVEEDRQLIWQTRLINPATNQHVLILEHDDQLCGFICVFANHDFDKGSIIESLHIAPEYQNSGLEKRLIKDMAEWIERYFPDIGVYIEVIESNQKAIDFYAGLGGLHEKDRIWNSPCGNPVPEYIFTWKTPKAIIAAVGDS
jgi:GNAT superfamily N-acetyltransferase